MLNKQKKWYEKAGEHSDVIISTRVRLARNLVDYPFPNRMTTEQKAEVEKKGIRCNFEQQQCDRFGIWFYADG